MAALARPPLLPPSSLPGGKQRQLKNTHPSLLHLLLTAGRATPPPHLLRYRSTPAAISTAAGQFAFDAPASAGDLSVLIPISTVLLIVYLVANFVVPEMISRDLQQGEASEDMLGETSAKVDEKVAMPSKPTGQSNKLRGSKGSGR